MPDPDPKVIIGPASRSVLLKHLSDLTKELKEAVKERDDLRHRCRRLEEDLELLKGNGE